ncbi:MAG: alcohol dehydrogenase catalytic domain-containing protein [Eubacterium sp.]|nr:alcohol dehydrogenase catalytic domain-containing protein [Eubacterium sp.]
MKGKMKVQNFYEPFEMKYEEHDIPEIADNEVLIKVMATSICGSDVSYYYGHSPLGTPSGKGPLYLGHEISGVVAEVGTIPAAAGLFAEGDRVAVNPVQQCNACESCMRGEFNVCEHSEVIGVSCNGGFAEYVKVKYTHVYKIPDEISFEQGALSEPLACATYGIKRLDIQLGQDVVIFGPGPIGLMMVQLAKASGAGRVLLFGRRDYPLETGKKVGADFIINTADKNSPYYNPDPVAATIEKFGKLAPRCIVPTSNMEALQNALKVTGAASTVVYFGLPGETDKLEIPMLEAINMDRTIKCAWLAPGVWDNVFHAIASGQVDLDPIITHRFTLEECEDGIKFMKESKENKIKGVVLIGLEK